MAKEVEEGKVEGKRAGSGGKPELERRESKFS